LARRTYFRVKSRKRGRILRERFGKKFDSDNLREFQVLGAVDLAHSATTGQGYDAIAFRNDLPRRKAAAANRV
jgi:hypothetical protein